MSKIATPAHSRSSYKGYAYPEDNTTENVKSKPRIVGYKMKKSDIKQKINRKTTFTKAKKPKYSFRPKDTTSNMLLKEKIETSKSLKKLNKEQHTTTIPSIVIKKTTDQPNDLKLSATTQRFEESISSIGNKSTVTNNISRPLKDNCNRFSEEAA